MTNNMKFNLGVKVTFRRKFENSISPSSDSRIPMPVMVPRCGRSFLVFLIRQFGDLLPVREMLLTQFLS